MRPLYLMGIFLVSLYSIVTLAATTIYIRPHQNSETKESFSRFCKGHGFAYFHFLGAEEGRVAIICSDTEINTDSIKISEIPVVFDSSSIPLAAHYPGNVTIHEHEVKDVLAMLDQVI